MPSDKPIYPSRVLLDQVADKWTILVLGALCAGGGKARFNAILRDVDGMTQKTLTVCLRKLERNGLIARKVLDTTPIGVEYSTTPLGYTLSKPFKALNDWAEEHLPDVEASQRVFDANNPKLKGATGG
jgi:DNA-binding HxlR family transcriptional regulator